MKIKTDMKALNKRADDNAIAIIGHALGLDKKEIKKDAESWATWNAEHKGPGKILSHTLAHGGGTFRIDNEGNPNPISKGYAVSEFPQASAQFSKESLTEKDIADWAKAQSALLGRPGAVIGTWDNKGTIYLDVSRVYEDKARAVSAGFKANQKAIMNLETFEETPTMGTGRNLEAFMTKESDGRMTYFSAKTDPKKILKWAKK